MSEANAVTVEPVRLPNEAAKLIASNSKTA